MWTPLSEPRLDSIDGLGAINTDRSLRTHVTGHIRKSEDNLGLGAELSLGGKRLYLLNHLVGLGNGHFKPSLKRSSSLFTAEAVSLTVKGDTHTQSACIRRIL